MHHALKLKSWVCPISSLRLGDSTEKPLQLPGASPVFSGFRVFGVWGLRCPGDILNHWVS